MVPAEQKCWPDRVLSLRTFSAYLAVSRLPFLSLRIPERQALDVCRSGFSHGLRAPEVARGFGEGEGGGHGRVTAHFSARDFRSGRTNAHPGRHGFTCAEVDGACRKRRAFHSGTLARGHPRERNIHADRRRSRKDIFGRRSAHFGSLAKGLLGPG